MQYVFGPYTLDTHREELYEAARVVRLDRQVFAVLRYLVQHRERVVKRQELFEQLWSDRFVSDAALERCITVARRAVGDSGRSQRVIQTVRGRGYRFLAPVEERPGEASHREVEPALDDLTGLPDDLWPVGRDIQETERRQLTILACQLVAEPEGAVPIDPEALVEALPAYHLMCAEVVRRFSGYPVQDPRDGLSLAYFGYPQAQEDDACRAVYAGLEIVEAMRVLQVRHGQEREGRFAVRVGVHTGMVVMDGRGSREGREPLALGQAPTIAAQVQGFAPPDTVAISPVTLRLVDGYVVCQPLGRYLLDDAAEPQMVFQVLQRQRPAPSRFAAAAAKGLTPFVGREAERTLLRQCWSQVKDGLGQMIMLSGEPGIGKSRLVQMLKDEIAREPYVLWECHSSPHHQQTPLFPLLELLSRVFQWLPEDSPAEKVAKLEDTLRQYDLPLPDIMPLFAALWSLPLSESSYPPFQLSPQRQREQTLESIVSLMLAQAEQQPMLLIVEDLHWSDPTTLELLNLLIDHIPTSAICALLTYRPDFQPLWSRRTYSATVTVGRLSRPQIARLATQVAGEKRLPAEVIQHLVDKTDGVPLYIEEMTKTVLESGYLEEIEGGYSLTGPIGSLSIPATLQGALMARLDRLMTAKIIAQYAAVIGRQFSHELLQAVLHVDNTTLRNELRRLVEAEIMYQSGFPPNESYFFKHALIQEAAYQSVLKTTRNQYHERIAKVLVEQFPQIVQTQPELLAYHYTEAGLHEQAIDYWQRAGENAIQHSANLEAIRHLTRGIELLADLPVTAGRAPQELMLYVALGSCLAATKGPAAPEVAQVFNRARELCQQTEDISPNLPVLFGLWRFYLISAQFSAAQDLASQLLRHAQRMNDSDVLVEMHLALGLSLFFLGDLTVSQEQLAQEMSDYDSRQYRSHILFYGHDPGIVQLSHLSVLLWLLGYPNQAQQKINQALRYAREVLHSHSLALALSYIVLLHQLLRETQDVQKLTEEAISLSTNEGFMHWTAHNVILRDYCTAESSGQEDAIDQLRQSLSGWQATGASLALPYFLGLLTKVYETANRVDEGLATVHEALNIVEKTGERWFEAELYRLNGELLLKRSIPDVTQVEAAFQQALDIARSQQAKSWELRAAMSLSRLWRRQGKRREAYDLLAPVYAWFTEGFDMADLKEAKELLASLS